MSEIRVDRFKAEDGISAPQFPNGIHVTGVVTATILDGTVPFLTVGSNAQAGASGIVTAKGADINGDIDVDGHSNFDNISIAGVTTISDDATLNFGAGNDLQIFHENSSGDNLIKSTVGSSDRLRIQGESIDFRNSVGNTFKMTLHGSSVGLYQAGNVKLATTSTGVSVTGDVSAATGTFSGNVTVGGVLTYEDVTNIDSVGIVTARLGLRVPDSQKLQLGTGQDLELFHTGNHSYIQNSVGNLLIGNNYDGDVGGDIYIQAKYGENSITCFDDGGVELFYDTVKRIETTTTGVSVNGTVAAANADIDDFVSVGSNIHLGNAGIITATSFVGNGANLTGIVAIPTGAIMAWPTESIPSGFLKCQGQAISRSTYSDLFSAIGVIYGSGDGSSTFNIPDYRGEFLRGRAEGSANDPDRGSRTNRGDGNGGDNVGTKQDYAVVNHSHGNNSGGNSNYGYNTNSNNTGQFSKSGHGYSANQCHSGGIVHSMSYGTNYANVNGHVTNNEVRPRNVYVHWIIKT